MKRIKNMWRYSIVFLLLIGISCHALSQVSFIASPSANKIGVKDRLQITFKISNATNLRDFNPPNFADFAVLQGPYKEEAYTITNGVQSSSISITYVLQPKHEGILTVPAGVAKDAAGHTYQSNTVQVQVVPGSLAPQRQPRNNDDDDVTAMLRQMQQFQQQMNQQMQQMSQQAPMPQAQPQMQQPQKPVSNPDDLKKDLFVKILVDKSKVRIGEQVTATFKLYAREPVNMNVSNIGLVKLPQLMGFWTQYFNLPPQAKPTEETLDGKKYQVLTFEKTALFPQQTGTLNIDPYEIRCVVQKVLRRGRDFWGNPAQVMDAPVVVQLQSPSDKITVSALPEKDKPADFGGAVGNFSISAKLDKQELTTDNIATLTVNITGSGNIKLIEAPKFVLPNGISAYDPQIVDTLTGHSTTVSGSKIITYPITPHTPGDYDIPSITFSYFNPQTGRYVTEHTQPLKLHVIQGKNYNPVIAHNNSTTTSLSDIHDISKLPLNGLSYSNKPLLLSVTYWSMYALPLLAFIGIIGWKHRDEELSKNTVLLRNKRANKIALQRLVTAKKLLQQQSKTPFYEEVSKAIWLYLSDKMNIPLSALSRDAAREGMSVRKVPDHVQKNLENVIWECETALYASGGSDKMEHTYNEAIKVISDLENVFKA